MDQRKRVVVDCLNAAADLASGIDAADEEELRRIVGALAMQLEQLAMAVVGIDSLPHRTCAPMTHRQKR